LCDKSCSEHVITNSSDDDTKTWVVFCALACEYLSLYSYIIIMVHIRQTHCCVPLNYVSNKFVIQHGNVCDVDHFEAKFG